MVNETEPTKQLIALRLKNNTPDTQQINILNGYISTQDGTAEVLGNIWTCTWKIADLVAAGFILPFTKIAEKYTNQITGANIPAVIVTVPAINTWNEYVTALQVYADNKLGVNQVVFTTDGVNIYSNSYTYTVDAITGAN